jgi:Uma2 family endonuclease
MISPDEFLDQEAVSATKHTYYRGVVTPWDEGHSGRGCILAHWTLAGNLLAALHPKLRGRGCRVGGSDLLFLAGAGTMYTRADVIAICGSAQTVQCRPEVITNPIFAAEVISPSTEATDRGAKSSAYRATASLRQYALIAQDEPWVEIYTRDDRGWFLRDVTGLDGTCAFSEISCLVPMAELYEGVLDIQPVE